MKHSLPISDQLNTEKSIHIAPAGRSTVINRALNTKLLTSLIAIAISFYSLGCSVSTTTESENKLGQAQFKATIKTKDKSDLVLSKNPVSLTKAVVNLKSLRLEKFGEGPEAGPIEVDLLADSVIVFDRSVDKVDYQTLRASFGADQEGEVRGLAFWLEGTVEKGAETRNFIVKHAPDASVEYLELASGDLADYDFTKTANIHAELEFSVKSFLEQALDFYDPFSSSIAVEDDGKTVIYDQTHNTAAITHLNMAVSHGAGAVILTNP